MATTVRVNESTRARASSLADAAGTSIGELISRALDAYESTQFWDETREALASAPVTDRDERREWDRTLRDGLTRE